MEWKSIETAPREGELIVLARFTGDTEWIKIGFHEEAKSEDEVAVWWSSQDEDECVPTHWCELEYPK